MSPNNFTDKDYKFFAYTEVQDYMKDIEELISHSELTNINASSSEKISNMFSEDPHVFNTLSEDKRISFIRRLMDELESISSSVRMRSARTLLFIALGCSDGPNLQENVNEYTAENIILLFRLGVFPLLVISLNMERLSSKYRENLELEKAAFTDSTHLRVILNVLSLIVGQMLIEKKLKRHKKDVDLFIEGNLSSQDEDSLLFILFEMMTEFSSSEKPGYPIKKILILILKIIMISFGDLKDLCLEKRTKRIMCELNNDHLTDLDINTRMYKSPLLHKVSKKDLNNYVHIISLKCRELNGTMALESIESLKKNLYVSLSELQVKEKVTQNENIEILYRNMLPKMKLYIQSLLQIFQSSLRSPVFNEFVEGEDSMLISSPLIILGKFHMFEYLEIMNKAISGILLLLLKHFKMNHIYQFEYMCQEMVSCNAIPIMKTYVETTSDLFFVLAKTRNQRNLCTCVNILRILNKLLKGKYSPVKSFLRVNCKSLHSLTSLNNKHLEVYSSKLLKILSKSLGRKWRQDNIKIMNKIFQNVRHRPLEEWNSAFQNNNDDEEMLKKRIDFFNAHYSESIPDQDNDDNYEAPVELTDFFKKNYEEWLEREVFQNPFDWDILLKH